MPELSVASGRELMAYCYTGRVRSDAADLEQLLAAAIRLDMVPLKMHCLEVSLLFFLNTVLSLKS
jgi:hypothetical protein